MWKAKRKSKRRKNDRKMEECEEFRQKREQYIAKLERMKREFEEFIEKREQQREIYGISYDELVDALYYANHKDIIDETTKMLRELADEE